MITKKVLVVIPAGLLEDIAIIQTAERRTRTNLIVEALRIYISNFHSEQAYAKKMKVVELFQDQ